MNRGSVLAVDDDALFRAALVRYLESENFAVVAEGDPSAALERKSATEIASARMNSRAAMRLQSLSRQAAQDLDQSAQ